MRKRQAKRGPNGGGYFYGCSRYPKCKGTRPIDEVESASERLQSETDEAQVNRSNKTILQNDYPTPLDARARADGYSAVFFDIMALPNKILSATCDGKIDRRELLKYSKWRLDIPIVNTDHLLTDGQKAALLVVNKIVNRGTITRLSPNLEKNIRKKLLELGVQVDNSIDPKTIFNTYANFTTPHIPSHWHDGEPRDYLGGMSGEEYVYKKIILDEIGAENACCVVPQVFLGSLVGRSGKNANKASRQRVDFLVSNGDEAIVVELDDSTHAGHSDKDDMRDKQLRGSGYETYRIVLKNGDDDDGSIGKLRERLRNMFNRAAYDASDGFSILLAATKLAHQVQVTILALFESGLISNSEGSSVCFASDNIPSLPVNYQDAIVKVALDDLLELERNVASLYMVPPAMKDVVAYSSNKTDSDKDVLVSVNDVVDHPVDKTVYIQDVCYPTPIDNPLLGRWQDQKIDYKLPRISLDNVELPGNSTADIDPSTSVRIGNINYMFNYVFRYEAFRENQLAGIICGINRDDVVVLLPTGSGKSVIYQMLTFIMPGIVLVIDPLVSLIEDQVDNLYRAGIDKVLGLTSNTKDRSEVMNAIARKQYVMVYSSPERFVIKGFRDSVQMYCQSDDICICAIDEAHCVSEWGHDFRPSYLNLANTIRSITRNKHGSATIMALTGTASDAVLNDMVRDLEIPSDMVIQPTSFDRPEIHFSIIPVKSADKGDKLKDLIENVIPEDFDEDFDNFYALKGKSSNCGIIFCPHIGGDFGVVKALSVINELNCTVGNSGNTERHDYWHENDYRTMIYAREYYGRQTEAVRCMSDEEWEEYKRQSAKDFKRNKFTLLCSTKSFGMGIDKPNIRFTINYCMPQSIEEFYQEVGRAGRDGKRAKNYMLISNDYPGRNEHLVSDNVAIEDVVQQTEDAEALGMRDDVTRVLYFHNGSYAGIRRDKDIVRGVVKHINFADSNAQNVVLNYARSDVEKAVHRLITLGVVRDYTLDYANEEFSLWPAQWTKESVIEHYKEYVSGYQHDEMFIKNKIRPLEELDSEGADFIADAVEILLSDFIYDSVEKSRRTTIRNLLTVVNNASALSGDEQDAQIRKDVLEFLSTTYAKDIRRLSDNPRDLQIPMELVDSARIQTPKLLAQINRALQSYPDSPSMLLTQLICIIRLHRYDNVKNLMNYIGVIIRYACESYMMDYAYVLQSVMSALRELSDSAPNDYGELVAWRTVECDDGDLLIDIVPDQYRHIILTNKLYMFTKPVIDKIKEGNVWTK